MLTFLNRGATLALLLMASACQEHPTTLGPPAADAGKNKADGKPAGDARAPDKSSIKHDGGVSPRDGAKPPRDQGKPPKDSASPKPDAGPKLHPARYPTTRTHSPLSPWVVQRLKQISKAGPGLKPRVFAKVGDSITVSSSFLHCYASAGFNLGAHGSLASTIQHFNPTLSGSTTPFNRTSLAAVVGWSAWSAIKGSPNPLAKEVAAISPRLALVMYGTNDIQGKNIRSYADNMLDLVDQLLKAGVIPLLSTIPPRLDAAWANLEVPRYNGVVRGIAQGRQVPLLDLHRELVKLPGMGMAGDGVHLKALWTSGGKGACDLGTKGLTYGYNTRNLLSVQSLSRVKAVLLDGKAAPDPAGPTLQGAGTLASPILMDALPFVDLRDTSKSTSKSINVYPGCSSTADESGPEVIYRLTLTQPATIRAMVFDRGTVDIDVHLLGAKVSGASCLKRGHHEVTAQLQAGTYHLSLDTFTKGGVANAGEYLLVVLKE